MSADGDKPAVEVTHARLLPLRSLHMLGWLAVERVVRFTVSFVVGAAVARHLEPAAFGVLSAAVALASLFGFLGSAGLELLFKREVLAHPDRSGALVSTVVLVRLAGAFLAFAMTGVFAWWSTDDLTLRSAALIAAVAFVPAVVTVVDWSLQAQQRGRASSLALSAGTFASALFRVGLIVTNARIEAFAAALVVDALIVAIVLCGIAWRDGWPFSWRRFDGGIARDLLKEAWPLMIAGAAVAVYMRIDQVMLTWWRGAEDVGQYSAAVRIAELPQIACMMLATAFFPEIVRAREAGLSSLQAASARYFRLNVLLALTAAAVLGIGAPLWVVAVFGARYEAAVLPCQILAGANIFVFLGVARAQVLATVRVAHFQAWAAISGAVFNVLLNAVLIPRWGTAGAAWATLAAHGMAAWLMSFALGREHRWVARALTRALVLRVS